MPNENLTVKIRGVNRRIGFVRGAWLGSLLRILVTVAFIFCLQLASEEMDAIVYLLAFPSAIIGFFAGGIAGATCNPRLGAALGGTLSGASCFGLILVPIGLASLAIPPKASDPVGVFALGLTIGLIAMIVAGGIAGYFGARTGLCSVESQQNES
jgi:hypothetical protein